MTAARDFAVLVLIMTASRSACFGEGRSPLAANVVPLDTMGSVALRDDGHPLFGTVGALRIGNRIIVANGGAAELLFFELSGGLQGVAGHRGAGPGEFQRLAWVQRAENQVFALDNLLQGIAEFDLDGALVQSTNVMPPDGYLGAQPEGVFPDGSILVTAWKKFSPAGQTPSRFRDTLALLRYDRAGAVLHSVGAYLGPDT